MEEMSYFQPSFSMPPIPPSVLVPRSITQTRPRTPPRTRPQTQPQTRPETKPETRPHYPAITDGDEYYSHSSNFTPLTSMIIMKYMGIDSSEKGNQIGPGERIKLVRMLYKQALKDSEVRDEIFEQISKKTRNGLDRQHLIRAWELMYLCASCMPPSKDIGGNLSEYIHDVVHNADTYPDVQVLAMNALNALKCSVKVGPRHTVPCREEIEALLIGKKLTIKVFLLDETYEEISYHMATTVSNVVEEVAGIIKLSPYSNFSLFECRKSPEPGNEEYIGLDDKKYIGDLLAEFKLTKDPSKGEISQCKLTFKKKLFLESDEAITDPIFVQPNYYMFNYNMIIF
ncbi:hypothetical protein L1987_37058 [Smallanthus sonchifolius]|uniref:Uncharacterized protein n=1 Tax=Smallanthus sonchifolius TaxID=185202 RepID=A0ACB9HGM7_9ASTR|nr:hypothetical protein L1987_37058 [Smallanthus sonchifolius]